MTPQVYTEILCTLSELNRANCRFPLRIKCSIFRILDFSIPRCFSNSSLTTLSNVFSPSLPCDFFLASLTAERYKLRTSLCIHSLLFHVICYMTQNKYKCAPEDHSSSSAPQGSLSYIQQTSNPDVDCKSLLIPKMHFLNYVSLNVTLTQDTKARSIIRETRIQY